MPVMLFTLTLSHLPQAFLPRLGTPFILGTTIAGVVLTAIQVPAWADLLVDWTTMAWSFFSCSKRDLSGNGQPWLSPTGS